MDDTQAIEAFSALAQPSRLGIYRLLVQVGPKGLQASEISKRMGSLPSTLSGHLAQMKRAGLLGATRHSREIHYAARLQAITDLVAFMLSNCCDGQTENCREILSLLDQERAA